MNNSAKDEDTVTKPTKYWKRRSDEWHIFVTITRCERLQLSHRNYGIFYCSIGRRAEIVRRNHVPVSRRSYAGVTPVLHRCYASFVCTHYTFATLKPSLTQA